MHFPDSIFQDYFLDRFSITESGASAFFVTFTIHVAVTGFEKVGLEMNKLVLEVLMY